MTQSIEGITHLGSKGTTYVSSYDPTLLEKFENPVKEKTQFVGLDCFEFQSRCPITDQPDFATIHINYIPNEYMVESKSLKLYLFSFQSHGAFHESCIDTICQDLVNLLDPKYIEVYGDFNSRGGISILPFSQYSHEDFKDVEKARMLEMMNTTMVHHPRSGK